jgi:hypothetical protein
MIRCGAIASDPQVGIWHRLIEREHAVQQTRDFVLVHDSVTFARNIESGATADLVPQTIEVVGLRSRSMSMENEKTLSTSVPDEMTRNHDGGLSVGPVQSMRPSYQSVAM